MVGPRVPLMRRKVTSLNFRQSGMQGRVFSKPSLSSSQKVSIRPLPWGETKSNIIFRQLTRWWFLGWVARELVTRATGFLFFIFYFYYFFLWTMSQIEDCPKVYLLLFVGSRISENRIHSVPHLDLIISARDRLRLLPVRSPSPFLLPHIHTFQYTLLADTQRDIQ